MARWKNWNALSRAGESAGEEILMSDFTCDSSRFSRSSRQAAAT
jgi:hypothetical protein